MIAVRHVAEERRLLRMEEIFALIVLASLVSGCVQSGPIARAPQGDPIAAARALSDAPDRVRTGDAKHSCGTFVLTQSEAVPTGAVRCLAVAASTGEAAELAWSAPTTEGHPIVTFAFVTPNTGEITVYSTNAFDSYGGDPRWTRTSCGDAATATSLMGCPTPSQ